MQGKINKHRRDRRDRMTTNANKFGLRAAALERTSRHAQRTPLPPRPGTIADAREAISMGKQIMSEQLPEGDITPTARKAGAFAVAAVDAGWEVTVSPEEDERIDLVAVRGPEAIHQAWLAGRWQYEASTHTISDRTTRPRNAMGASRLLTRTSTEASAELSKVKANKHFKRNVPAPSKEERRASLPFDIDDLTDDGAIELFTGRTITWINRMAGSTTEARVTDGKWRRVVIGQEGERVFQFCDSGWTGFRAFRISDVIGIR